MSYSLHLYAHFRKCVPSRHFNFEINVFYSFYWMRSRCGCWQIILIWLALLLTLRSKGQVDCNTVCLRAVAHILRYAQSDLGRSIIFTRVNHSRVISLLFFPNTMFFSASCLGSLGHLSERRPYYMRPRSSRSYDSTSTRSVISIPGSSNSQLQLNNVDTWYQTAWFYGSGRCDPRTPLVLSYHSGLVY